MAIVPTQKVQLLERMLYFLPFSITAGPVLTNRTDYEIFPMNRVTQGARHAAIREPEFKRNMVTVRKVHRY